MAEVTISYKGNTIAEMDESGSKTLKTSGKYCEGDIGIEYVKSGGGGVVSKPELWEGVNFIDYDGKIIETWTPEETASKTELPTPPTHDEFTDSGWNWELSQIKTYIAENPQACIYVGAEYNVKNGDTVIFVSLADNTQLSPMVVLGVNGTVTIDWGDGTTTDVTGTNIGTAIPVIHTYGAIGNYKIRFSGSPIIFKYDYTAYNGGSLFCGNQYYKNCVKEIWLGNVENSNQPILYMFPSMERVLISKAFVGAIPSSFMDNTNNLRCLVLHSKITGVGFHLTNGITNRVSYNPFLLNSFVYSNFYNGSVYLPYKYGGINVIKNTNAVGILFRKVTIPNNQYVVKIPSYFMYGCEFVGSLVIPKYITTIEAAAFNGCKSLQEFHFKPTTPPTVANSNAFSGVPTTCKIYVPQGTLSAYTQATNYPDPNTYTYIEE